MQPSSGDIQLLHLVTGPISFITLLKMHASVNTFFFNSKCYHIFKTDERRVILLLINRAVMINFMINLFKNSKLFNKQFFPTPEAWRVTLGLFFLNKFKNQKHACVYNALFKFIFYFTLYRALLYFCSVSFFFCEIKP